MTREELDMILERHTIWLTKNYIDRYSTSFINLRADFENADLTGLNLDEVNLARANFKGANLHGCSVRQANLSWCNFEGADLSKANLIYSNFNYSNMVGANLTNADMYNTTFNNAAMNGIILLDKQLKTYFPICCPDIGSFTAWKKASKYIIKLTIPEDAKRSSAFGRKCRASKAIVEAIENYDGSPSIIKSIPSDYDHKFIYKIGKTVEVEDFDDDRTNECAPGIHFFITRGEALSWGT